MVRSRSFSTLALCGFAVAAAALPAAAANAAPAGTHGTWYIRASAPAHGDGSAEHPLNSLAAAQRLSRPYDTLVVLPAPVSVSPLDGGIALKVGQRLRGSGGPVTKLGAAADGPRITNTTLARHHGDAVELADHTRVSNLIIDGTARGAIYGLNTSGVTIQGNNVSRQNTSCTPGFYVLPFSAPTNTPGVGVTVPAPGLSNGWAALMVDGDHGAQAVAITDNYIHNGTCGDGIDLRASGTASISGTVSGNYVTGLPQGSGLRSVLAIGMQAQGASRLAVDVDRNTETYIGSPGADCEGLFANLNGTSHLTEHITHNTFAHGIGGASCNGLENILSSGSAVSELSVSDSSFTDNPGDMFEEANLGTGASMSMDIIRTTIARTTIAGGNAGPIPFNIGECLTATVAGARDNLTLHVDQSLITGCNNGLSVGSNVVAANGTGPAGDVSVAVTRSTVSDSASDDVFWHNLTATHSLSLRIEDTTLRGAGEAAVRLLQEPGATTGSAWIDLGGGSLGSPGRNNIIGSPLAVMANRYEIDARHDWWGQRRGPTPAQLALTPPARLHYQPALTSPTGASSAHI